MPIRNGRFTPIVTAFGCLLLLSLTAHGVNLRVRCGGRIPPTSISGALKLLNPAGPNTLTVSGTCNEAVTIAGFDNLTLLANPGASINDPTPSIPDDNDVLDVSNSHRITVTGFAINGGIYGIACVQYSICLLNNNTVRNASDVGVVIGRGTQADLTGNVIQNNSGNGLSATNGANVLISGGTIQSNGGAGAFANDGSVLRFFSSDGTTPVAVQNNGFDGVFGTDNATIVLGFNGAVIDGNNGTGVTVGDASVARIAPQNQITGNAGAGVGLGESSFASVAGNANVSGNTAGDVVCVGTFSNAKVSEPNTALSCHNP
jgi:hypothetical protein